MEITLTTSIEPIEVAFVRAGADAALDVAAVRAVERGLIALEGRRLRAVAAPGGNDVLTDALIAAASNSPRWTAARNDAKFATRDARRTLERRLVAAGLLREAAPWRWITGRRTRRGDAWLDAAQLAYPAAQIVAIDPALALALYGPRALDGTRYHAATVAAAATSAGDGGGCGASFAGDGGHGGGHGGHGGDGGGGSGCSGGGCGGGGCGG